MDQLVLHSPAKVNLTLDVGAKRAEDGYHFVDTIMLPISLVDRITLRKAPEVRVTVSPDIAGSAESNLAYRAAMLLKEATGYSGGADISIQKVIPVAGGLAGGSTNGATVLKGLNQLWETGLTDEEMIGLAMSLGSDVPFFIRAVPARVQGIGERVTPVVLHQPLWLVLATPPVAKSTGNVYRLFDELEHVDRPNLLAMEKALATGDVPAIGTLLGNVFEPVMMPRHPEIAQLKQAMREHGALGAIMSGAGPTVFGLVASQEAGRRLQADIERYGARTFLVTSLQGDGYGS